MTLRHEHGISRYITTPSLARTFVSTTLHNAGTTSLHRFVSGFREAPPTERKPGA
jgi:hypothetical protein